LLRETLVNINYLYKNKYNIKWKTIFQCLIITKEEKEDDDDEEEEIEVKTDKISLFLNI